ncbi:hypothetical protein VFPPC_18365 [Pochonia chlamydosporia 170]|uniref:Uncharacterized protein n=1 Tax=Pochonia chlamydosporia 170 TaxID=1380566 RepID=A0A219ARK6_METCM|nr:hypothetical protein VFPPC_18365 [Pochonia chlamydosporia 170]OWT43383.1 hypothetical protein VFPPC_18365 [Pochonia chlamydosporia 170]
MRHNIHRRLGFLLLETDGSGATSTKTISAVWIMVAVNGTPPRVVLHRPKVQKGDPRRGKNTEMATLTFHRNSF